MIDEAQAAVTLFGSPSPSPASPAPTQAPPQATMASLRMDRAVPAPAAESNDDEDDDGNNEGLTDEQAQERLYPPEALDPHTPVPVPAEVAEIRRSIERRMFSAQLSLSEAIPDTEFNVEGLAPAIARKAVVESREMAADLDFGPADVRLIRERAAAIAKDQPEIIEQRELAVQALNARFGNTAKQALMDARLLLQRDPRAARIVEKLGLGDDAATVVMLAERARSQIAAGRLRRGK